MSKNGSEQHDERLSEELVAYLDGELSAAESEAVEARIRHDDRARSELQKLDRVWNALDGLERPTVDDSFTRTTIEMAAVEARKELAEQTAMLPVRRRNRWFQLASLATVAAVVGFAALAALLPNPNRQLYAHLPVIMELDAYSEVRDIEFLRLLNRESSQWLLAEWGGEVSREADALKQLTYASYSERSDYVDQLGGDERTELASKHRRYQSLTPEMREELTAWHQTLAMEPDAGDLQRTMLAYYAWVSTQDEVDQARLRTLAPAERVARVEEMQRWQQRRSETRLSPPNLAAVRNEWTAMASDPKIKRMHRELVDSVPDVSKWVGGDDPRDFRKQGMRALKQSSPRIAILMIEMASGFGDRQPPFKHFAALRDIIEQRLIDALDEETAERLRGLDQQDRSRRLAMWLAMSSRHDRNPDVATLEEYFVSGNLSPEDQQWLLALPRDQMLEELERRYIEEFLGDGSDDQVFREMMQGFGGRGRFDGRRRWGDRDGVGRPEARIRGRDDRGPRGPGGPPEGGPDGPRSGRPALDRRPGPPPGEGPPPR